MHPIQANAVAIRRKFFHPPAPVQIPIAAIEEAQPIEIEVRAPEPAAPVDPDPIPRRTPTVAAVISAVCAFYKVREVDIRSERRTSHDVRPRQIAMYLARTVTGRSMPFIGDRLGGKDHTTVLHGYRKITMLIQTDRELSDEVSYIARSLEGG